MKATAYNDLAKAIYEILEGKKGEDLVRAQKDVVRFLNSKRLLSETRNILTNLERIANEKEGIIKAKISSATILSEDRRHLIKEMLKKRYSVKGVEMNEKEDKRLLGGVRIEVNDEVIDNTIRGKVNKLQEYLIK